MFDHRTTVDVRERFAREAGGSESRGDDDDDVQRRSRIDPKAGRSRAHDE
jgi:hypothetical protein